MFLNGTVRLVSEFYIKIILIWYVFELLQPNLLHLDRVEADQPDFLRAGGRDRELQTGALIEIDRHDAALILAVSIYFNIIIETILVGVGRRDGGQVQHLHGLAQLVPARAEYVQLFGEEHRVKRFPARDVDRAVRVELGGVEHFFLLFLETLVLEELNVVLGHHVGRRVIYKELGPALLDPAKALRLS